VSILDHWLFAILTPPKLLLVWNPGKGSPIHDHANAHCILKVLAGELTETIYNMPEKGCEDRPLSIKSANTHQADQVTYISDDIGLHRVHNPHPTQVAVSLHSKFQSFYDFALNC
jgi:cysteine dioxygenase